MRIRDLPSPLFTRERRTKDSGVWCVDTDLVTLPGKHYQALDTLDDKYYFGIAEEAHISSTEVC